MNIIEAIRARLADARRERLVRRYGRFALRFYREGDIVKARLYGHLHRDQIARRSAAQVRRMEFMVAARMRRAGHVHDAEKLEAATVSMLANYRPLEGPMDAIPALPKRGAA